MRLHLVDGIRGHLLIGMLIAHLSFEGMGLLNYFHHAFFIRMYDAEFFVPLSGFIIGYLFDDRIKTTAKFYKFLNGRLLTIYKYYLLSALPFLLGALMAKPSLWDFLSLAGSVAIMQNGGIFSDILPIYFYCFLLLYALFWLIPRLGFLFPLLVSGTIYVISQATYSAGWFGVGDRFIVFDIAAWQFFFMLFLFVGAHRREALELIKNLPRPAYFLLVVALGLLLVISRETSFFPTPFAGYEALNANWPRMQLHPIYLAKILVVIVLFCAVLVRPDGLLAWPNKLMRWYLSLPVLINVGKFSIQMFTLHVFMMAVFKEMSLHLLAPERYALALGLVFIFIAAPNAWVSRKLQSQTISLSAKAPLS